MHLEASFRKWNDEFDHRLQIFALHQIVGSIGQFSIKFVGPYLFEDCYTTWGYGGTEFKLHLYLLVLSFISFPMYVLFVNSVLLEDEGRLMDLLKISHHGIFCIVIKFASQCSLSINRQLNWG